MAAKFQTMFSNVFSLMAMFKFRKTNQSSLFPSVQLSLSLHWIIYWLGAEQATNCYLNQCWPDTLGHICGTMGRWVNVALNHTKLNQNPATPVEYSCNYLKRQAQIMGYDLNQEDGCSPYLALHYLIYPSLCFDANFDHCLDILYIINTNTAIYIYIYICTYPSYVVPSG